MLLDGQRVRLDCKYGRVFEKVGNVPILMLGNRIPYSYNVDSFNSRVFEMYFFSDCAPLDRGRLAATLFHMYTKYALMAPPSMCRLEIRLKTPFTEYEKALVERTLGRPVESMEALDSLRANPSFRDSFLLPFLAFGSSKEISFPSNESAYRKSPLYVKLPCALDSLGFPRFCDEVDELKCGKVDENKRKPRCPESDPKSWLDPYGGPDPDLEAKKARPDPDPDAPFF